MRRHRLTRRDLIKVLAAGCALAVVWLAVTSRADPPGKSGARVATVLKLVVVEYPGTPAAQIAERFARRVEALSDDSIRVAITYWPARFEPATSSRQIEASAIRAVRSNTMQIGVIPSDAFQEQGVTTLRAVQAPFLVTSSAGAARVTTGPIADRLQAGLQAISLTGLGLVPEGLYRPFGFLKPLVTPADFAGVTIRAHSSKATYDLLKTLGARPVDLSVEHGDTAVYSDFGTGLQPLPTAKDEFPKDAYTAGNVVLFPKVDVVVVSNAAFGNLRAAQREILRRGAADARAATISATSERAAAAAFCKGGGSIVTAPAGALRALRTKAAPVLASMQRDPATRSLIASIERLGSGGGGAVRCAPTESGPSVAQGLEQYTRAERDSLRPPGGTYRRAFTDAQLRAAGADESEAHRNEGISTLTFYDWRFALEWRGPIRRPPCRGGIELTNRLVELRWNPATPCSGYVAFSWRRDGRDLVIVALDPRTEPGWLEKAYPGTWKRVDCTPDCGAREKITASETVELLRLELRGVADAPFVSCHRIPSFGWDYECTYSWVRNGKEVRTRFGVNVDDRKITRTSRGS
jgi:TRAP-type C4-dicarboxylate transport system substrate-binding protein